MATASQTCQLSAAASGRQDEHTEAREQARPGKHRKAPLDKPDTKANISVFPRNGRTKCLTSTQGSRYWGRLCETWGAPRPPGSCCPLSPAVPVSFHVASLCGLVVLTEPHGLFCLLPFPILTGVLSHTATAVAAVSEVRFLGPWFSLGLARSHIFFCCSQKQPRLCTQPDACSKTDCSPVGKPALSAHHQHWPQSRLDALRSHSLAGQPLARSGEYAQKKNIRVTGKIILILFNFNELKFYKN